MSEGSHYVRKIKSVLEWMIIVLVSLVGLFMAAMAMGAVYVFFFPESAAKDLRPTQVHTVIKDLRLAIHSYEIEYNRLPILGANSHHTDIAIRSKGPILPALLGKDATALNTRPIRFFDGPFDSDQKFGLWKDGSEWVLRDRWGELYYLVLDTNEDNVIANPDPDAAKSLPQIPTRVLIYSSGPDRDPKTWSDNICSWRVR